MPEEVKDPTQGVNVWPIVYSLILEKDNSKNQARLYSSHKCVANIEGRANHKKKKKKYDDYQDHDKNRASHHRENEREDTSMRPRTSGAGVLAPGNALCGTLYLRLVTRCQLLEK